MTFFSSTCAKNCCCYCYSHICYYHNHCCTLNADYLPGTLLGNTSQATEPLPYLYSFPISHLTKLKFKEFKGLPNSNTARKFRTRTDTPILTKAFAPSSVSYHHSSVSSMCQYHACDPNIYTDCGFFP